MDLLVGDRLAAGVFSAVRELVFLVSVGDFFIKSKAPIEKLF